MCNENNIIIQYFEKPNQEKTMTDKIYSILIFSNYENAPQKQKFFINTIKNNLLDKPFDPAEADQWKKYSLREKIRVSLVDIVSTEENVKKALLNGAYNVLIMDHSVGGKSVGAGTIDRLRTINDKILFIMLLHPHQRYGHVLPDGRVSEGRQVKNLYEKGYFNAIFKAELNINTLIKMIKSNGFSAEWALHNYGLINNAPALPIKDDDLPEAESEVSIDQVQASSDISAADNIKSQNIPVTAVEDTQFTPETAENTTYQTSFQEKNNTTEETVYQTPEIPPVAMPKSETTAPLPPNSAASGNAIVPHVPVPQFGFLSATVSFVQDQTVILKLTQPLEQQGASQHSILGTPVNIPFIKGSF